MNDSLILVALVAVAVIAAVLSLVAWYQLARPKTPPGSGQTPELDSDEPDV